MKKKFTNKRQTRKRNNAFCPDQAYIDAAVDEFLSLGGQIEILEFDENAFRSFVSSSESPFAVDEFLRGQ